MRRLCRRAGSRQSQARPAARRRRRRMDIADWLKGLGLAQYAAAFCENDITEALLPELTGEDLKDLGVGSVGHRRTLLKAIAALRGDAPQYVAEPEPAAAPSRS